LYAASSNSFIPVKDVPVLQAEKMIVRPINSKYFIPIIPLNKG